MDISVIIPIYQSEKYIKNCFNSALASRNVSFEIIAVVNKYTNASKKILDSYIKKVKLFYLDKDRGRVYASNFGAKKAKGKIFFMLDIDTEIQPNTLHEIVKKFRDNNKVGALQAKLIEGEKTPTGHFLTFFGFPYEIEDGRKIIFGARDAAMAVRSDVFEKLSGFDQDYFMHTEETDLSWRIWQAGYEIHYLPTAEVKHFGKSSLNKKTKHLMFYEGSKNSTSNIIKNAPLSILLYMLPLNILAWLAISVLRMNFAFSVYKGLWWNVKNLEKTLKKRKNPKKVDAMFGNESFINLVKKGLTWIKNL